MGEKEGCGGVRIHARIDRWFTHMSWRIPEEAHELQHLPVSRSGTAREYHVRFVRNGLLALIDRWVFFHRALERASELVILAW